MHCLWLQDKNSHLTVLLHLAEAQPPVEPEEEKEEDLSPITPVISPTIPIYDNSTDEEKTLGLSSRRSEISMAKRWVLTLIQSQGFNGLKWFKFIWFHLLKN